MAHQFFFNPYILDNLPAPSAGFDVVQDLSEPRLRMYVTSRGVKSFFVRKRVAGRDRRIIIGNYPDMDIEDARAAVPVVLENAMKKPRARRGAASFKKIIDSYMSDYVRRGEDGRVKLWRAINRHLAPLFDKNISDVRAADVADVIAKIQGPAIAARMQELCQSVFNFAVRNGYVKTNPIDDLPKIEQRRRVRPLNRAGMARLVAAIEEEENPVMRAAFLMLVYGFAPKSKIFSMQWEDLDFNHYMWGDWPLSDRAVVVLQDLPQDGQWVFSVRGGLHLTDPRFAWRRVARRAGIDNLTMDDVNKFLMRRLCWASDKEDFRANMNDALDDIFS